jgi:thioesterase domain-containing protein
MPGLAGHVISLRELALMFDADQPVYGLQTSGLSDDEPLHQTVEEMAAYFVKAVLRVCPQGPCHLVGFSVGGVIAFEMAHQLRRAGRSVGLLGMGDTYGPGYPKRPRLLKLLGLHALKVSELKGANAAVYAGERLRNTFMRLTGRKNKEMKDDPNDHQSVYLNRIAQAWHLARPHYQPRPYCGRIDLFRAAQLPDWLGCDFSDSTNGWGSLAEEVRVHSMKGTHVEVIGPGNEELARKVQQLLRERA